MRILGIDASILGTGFTLMEINDEYKTTDIKFLGFTQKKKLEYHSENLHICLLGKDYSDYPYHYRGKIILDFIKKYYDISNIDFMAIEDYAFGANGHVFNIAETIGSIKNEFYVSNIPYKKYPPSTIKQFATGKGNSDKVFMGMAFRGLQNGLLTNLEDYVSPKGDLVDSFWIAQLLRFELSYINLKKFPDDLFKQIPEHSIDAILGGKKKVKTLPAIQHPFIKRLL